MSTIQTARLTLRPWREDDAEALFRAASDPEVGPRAGWPAHQSVAESLEVIRTVFATPETYALVPRAGEAAGTAVGAAGLKFAETSYLVRGDHEAELGYWLARPLWGRGLMPEACAALLGRAFADLGLERVWAGHREGNAQSRRVMEKLGMTLSCVRPASEPGEGPEHVLVIERETWLARTGSGR